MKNNNPIKTKTQILNKNHVYGRIYAEATQCSTDLFAFPGFFTIN